MAGLAPGMREALPARRSRSPRLRIPHHRNPGKCARSESPRPAQPKPSFLSPLARGLEKVSLRRGKFPAHDLSRLGARSEAVAGFAWRNSRPYGSRSNDREKPEAFRGSRFYRVARESRGGTDFAASSISSEGGGESVSPADLARGIAGGKRSAIHGTCAPWGVGLLCDA